jgi:proteasome-associated ATPase
VARSEDAEARAARWEREAHDLATQVAFLQEELALVRRKLTESPRHVRQLEERIAATQAQLARVTENNERLVATLKEARAQIVTLKEEVDRLAQPPSGYGVYIGRHEDGTVDVFTGGRKLRVAVSPAVDVTGLRRGQEVLLNDALNIVDALGFERAGEVVMLKEILDGGDRALVISHADEERVVHLADTILDSGAGHRLRRHRRSGPADRADPGRG